MKLDNDNINNRITVRLTEDEFNTLHKIRHLLLAKTDRFPSLTDVFKFGLVVALERLEGESKGIGN